MKSPSTSDYEIRFSIVMANYNKAKYINEAIESVFNQTYPLWELVIVDDCSSDKSIDIIYSYLEKGNVKLIKHKKNLGNPYALSTGIKNCSNEVIGILDSDDKLHKDALKEMARAYKENPECGFIYSNMWMCDKDLNIQEICPWIGEIKSGDSVLFKMKVSHFKTFRIEAFNKISGLNSYTDIAADYDLIIKLEEVTRFKYIDIPLYYYREYENSFSHGKEKEFKRHIGGYIAQNNAYLRRKNTSLPNLTKNYLYRLYFRLTFHRIIELINISKIFNQFFKILNKIIPIFRISNTKIEKLLDFFK